MEVGKLKGARESEYQRYVVVGSRGCDQGQGYLGGGQGMRRNAAGQRGIVVDIKFEEVEEGIVNGFEGTIGV